MSHKSLREVAKFAAGLVAADFLTLLWMSQQKHFFPVSFLGGTMSADMVLPAMVFDLALIIILVHYGWHIGTIPRMKERTYLLVAGIIFTVVAVVHLFRIFFGADFVILGWDAPLWLSWVGTAVTAYLAYASYRFAMHMK